MRTRKIAVTAASVTVIAAASSGLTMAQTAPQPSNTTATTLSPVVVTSNPIIDRVRIDPFSSTSAVVTESQLRDQNAFDLATALRRTPGVQISRYNPVGAFGGDQGGATSSKWVKNAVCGFGKLLNNPFHYLFGLLCRMHSYLFIFHIFFIRHC